MSDASKRYTEREFSLILAKAAELAGSSSAPGRSEDGLTLEEITSIAVEAGLDPDAVVRAARLVSDEVRPSLLGRILGGTFRVRSDFSLPGEFTDERAQRLLATARSTMKTRGDGDASASGMSWSTRAAGYIFVSGHGEGGETRVQVAVDNRPLVLLPAMLGIAGFMATLYTAIAAGNDGWSNPYLILAGGLGLTAAGVWSALRRLTRRTRATLEHLIEAIGDALHRERP